MLRNADWHLATDVSAQPVGHNFKGQAVQKEKFFCDFLTFENGTDMLFLNVGNKLTIYAA